MEARAADSAFTETYITAGTQMQGNRSQKLRLNLRRAFLRRGRRFLLWRDGREGGVARRRLAFRTQRRHITDDSFDLARRKILPIGRHVAAALNDLANELISGQTGAHIGEIRGRDGRPPLRWHGSCGTACFA